MSKLDVDLFLTLLAQEVDAHQIEGISIVQSKIKQLETQLGINTKALEEALDEIENQDAKIKQLEFDCEDFIKAAKIALEDRDKQVMKVRRLEDGKKEVFKYLRHHNYISESVLGEIELIYDSIAKKAVEQK